MKPDLGGYTGHLACAVELLLAGKPVVFTARGGSMRPWIRAGDQLCFERCPDGPKVGEVVWFGTDRWDATHRLIAVDQQRGYQTCGDALSEADPWWEVDGYLGTLKSIKRGAVYLKPPHHRFHLTILAFVRGLRHINWARKKFISQIR